MKLLMGVALIALIVTALIIRPSADAKIVNRSRADLDPDSRTCFDEIIASALDKIAKADPKLAAMIDQLQKSSTIHLIEESSGITYSYGSWWTRSQVILYNPQLRMRFPDSQVCTDPVADLAHELQHAFDNDSGKIDALRSSTPIDHLKQSEINAVQTENIYRNANGLCERLSYDKVLLPGATAAASCPGGLSQLKADCPPIGKLCPQYVCCFIQNVFQSSSACTIDNITCGECRASFDGAAGCVGSPCNWPGVPSC